MRLNEDEPLVWRDERAKVGKREAQRRARILEAGGRLKAEREFQKGEGMDPGR